MEYRIAEDKGDIPFVLSPFSSCHNLLRRNIKPDQTWSYSFAFEKN